ncbi:Molybdopterin oxidoreductase Fe4S4 domain-containing protein [Desulfacinum hydrothermale DSM 13146]|uniref:Molybdopterin oxidoreductase Fe4S4 domain-containing protein n=3 Tax=Desulfacinum hydrothermale TaxID=109258 RepID=A0A1W1X4Q2_9BACT|nr:Molybdopterin oxidoreductase Fe4S4 domain-containing protein [Desulfacinum hydrothermale DSM 13146]
MDCRLVPSVCSYCGTGCGVLFSVIDGTLVGTYPIKTHPVNEGSLCIKGWNLHEHITSPKRLRNPMIRRNGQLQPVSWDEAIQEAASRLRTVVEEHGPDSVGVLTSAKITNEENYLAQKLARTVIGTNNVDHCARL